MINVAMLLDEVAADGPGETVSIPVSEQSFQAVIVGDGAVSATVAIEVSFNRIDWDPIGVVELTGTNRAHGLASIPVGFLLASTFPFCRGRVMDITGTDAKVSLFCGFSPK